MKVAGMNYDAFADDENRPSTTHRTTSRRSGSLLNTTSSAPIRSAPS